ncbi:hypothetical protein L1987_37987 [Smallanthus sonchifolius]|uniref:Uncharacterized protein n=1 Tax=Smallanthus sonchifolius TaxID=185202 RepID=A0ACB9HJQ1_9ASTR|nr:hypothetical protein L1987_37987 [Smallanthus sonchifolius]
MIKSMVQRIQHGNKKRADEMKIYQELRNFKDTKESYVAPEPHPDWYPRERRSKRDTDWERSMQHKLNIWIGDLEKLKGEQIGRKSKVRRLKAELVHVRKNICYLNKKLENVDSKILKAYKSAKELGDQNKALVS